MKLLLKLLPWAIVLTMGLYVAGKAMTPSAKTREFDLYAFGKIPVQHGGRVQPLDSLARNTLMILTAGRQEYVWKEGTREETRPAIRWLLDVTAGPNAGAGLEVFRIDDPDLRGWLGLKDRPGSYRYSLQDMRPKWQELLARGSAVRKKPPEQRDQFEMSIHSLMSHIEMQIQLVQFSAPGLVPNAESPTGKWLTIGEINDTLEKNLAEQARALGNAKFEQDLKDNRKVYEDAKNTMTKPDEFRAWLEKRQDDFVFEQMEQLTDNARKESYPQAALFMEILRAHRADNVAKFNADVEKYHREYVARLDPSDVGKANSEAWMNHFEPFFLCKVLYIMVMALACFSWLTPSDWNVGRSAFLLACLTLGVHTLALVLRMFIGSRPPVTNLYSSAVFIGWGCLVLCMIMEAIYKNGLGSFIGGLSGMASMIIAQLLSQGGDTLEMLQAVLDTNFWLATHVTIVTLGYTATFVAGFLGAAYIFAGMFTNALRKDGGRAIYQMTYGTVCFATLLSFVGTVLGGIWADQSWGRFWGWDPKENGAVLIVIWNALALHARWAGIVKARGFAVLSVFGNIVTAWSWFGTNQLGIGLHAYGFNKQLADSCAIFWVSQVLIMALGAVPLPLWASFGPEPEEPKKTK